MNLVNYTVIELKALAREKGLKGYSIMRKDELCNLLNLKCHDKRSPVKIKNKKAVTKNPKLMHLKSQKSYISKRTLKEKFEIEDLLKLLQWINLQKLKI